MKRITASQYQTSERYYKLPKLLFESERYKNMKLEVKVVYSVLKDRLELSRSPMIDLYLSKNNHRNQILLDFFQNYGIEVSCHSISEMTKDKLIEMMSYSSDCFEFLSPNLLRFKNRDNLRLTDFIEMILKNPELSIRLPLAVSNKRVYPNLNLEEARALLPRDTKQLIYMAQTHYLSN